MSNLPADAEFAPHAEFWSELSYSDFVDGNVPNIPGEPVKILIKGNAADSAIILALQGEGMFAPGKRFRRMPAGGPYFSNEQIAEIADWIDRGCPE
jgi:hypothetical protein